MNALSHTVLGIRTLPFPENDFTNGNSPLHRLRKTVPDPLPFLQEAKQNGQPIVGLFCEFIPRELILAAGAIPVFLGCPNSLDSDQSCADVEQSVCPLVKNTLQNLIDHENPLLELVDLLIAETTCDAKRKMFEIAAQQYPVHVVEVPKKTNEPVAFAYWLDELNTLKRKLEELTGKRITNQALQHAIERMNEDRSLRRQVASMAKHTPPLLSGCEILEARSLVSMVLCDHMAYRMLLRWAKTRPSPYTESPRLLVTGVPHAYGAEAIVGLLEENGAVVVAQETCTGLKPIMDDVQIHGDPLENIASKYLEIPCACMTPNANRKTMLGKIIQEFQPHGIVELVWNDCHNYAMEAILVKKYIDENTDLPYITLAADDLTGDPERIQTRISAFLDLCRYRRHTPIQEITPEP